MGDAETRVNMNKLRALDLGPLTKNGSGLLLVPLSSLFNCPYIMIMKKSNQISTVLAVLDSKEGRDILFSFSKLYFYIVI